MPDTALDPSDAEAGRILITSHPTSKCPGPNGLRSDYLTHLPLARYASLTWLLQLILVGRTLPPIARWLLSNSKLLVFPKQDQHSSRTGKRPIGVPQLLRRLTGKRILKRLRVRMAEFFASLKVSKALSGGCEIAVLPSRSNLEAEGRGLPSMDLSSAFNTVNRDQHGNLVKDFSRSDPLCASHLRHPCPYVCTQGWTTPRHISVEEGVHISGYPGPALMMSPLRHPVRNLFDTGRHRSSLY